MFWKKKAQPAPTPVPEVILRDHIFAILCQLLENHPDWKVGTYSLDHSSGVRLWTANRTYADMKVYGGGSDDSANVIFSDSRRAILRQKANRVIRLLKMERGDALTPEEEVLRKLKGWDVQDPKLREILEVLV